MPNTTYALFACQRTWVVRNTRKVIVVRPPFSLKKDGQLEDPPMRELLQACNSYTAQNYFERRSLLIAVLQLKLAVCLPAAHVSPHIEGDFVVFLIGAGVNSWRNLPHLLFTGRSFQAMVEELKVRGCCQSAQTGDPVAQFGHQE